ncbi:MAG: transglutaminase-like domain-containing protein [Burkholderiales bacterium]
MNLAFSRMRRRLALSALLALLSGCASQYFRDAGTPPSAPRYTLADLPSPEHWTGIVFNGARVGFSRSRISRAADPGLYEIEGEAVIRLRFLGFEKNVQMRTLDVVDARGALARFDHRYVLDRSERRVRGEARGGVLRYEIGSAGRAAERREEILREPLYPSAALALLPVLRGLRVGSRFDWLVFDGEAQSLARASQRIEAYETSELFAGPAFRVSTELLGLSTTTWIDANGRPVLELGLNGVIVSALEDEATAKGYLASAALNKDDVLLDWSVIKVALPLADARRARYLRVALPRNERMPPSDRRQQCRREAADVVCEIDAARSSAGDAAVADLRSTVTVQSGDPMIRALALKITSGRDAVPRKITAVLDWLERNIRKEPIDAFSALDVLDARRAECQGHAYLYTALMRSLGVPTRVVNGLVYAQDYGGFLYHTWAETLVDGSWIAIDPTFNQARADATHIALARGESPVELVPLVDWVGRTRIEVLEAR